MPQTPEEGLRLSEEIKRDRTTGRGDCFESRFQKLRIVSGGNGDMLCEKDVEEYDRNSHGTLHGGLMCTLADTVSSWAYHTLESRNSASTDLHMTFMKPARVGSTILIDAKTVKLGKRLAFFSIDIKDKEQGFLIAHCRHTKMILDKGSKL